MDGFGACFNEMGWAAVSVLSPKNRAEIFRELFRPEYGANFTICRMPLAANDFAIDYYSYNDSIGDFGMSNFSIEHDRSYLIPFIKSAQREFDGLKIWASPWCPPYWMKTNQHYACSMAWKANIGTKYDSGLTPDKVGAEGTDMFIQQPEYLRAYALYFRKAVEAYRNEGIDIFAVMPQNEFNSAQPYPACTWTARGLANFIGEYLGPEMNDICVEVMLGTVERANYLLVDSILQHPSAKKYLKTAGFQWAGKDAIRPIREKYPFLKLIQTEQECGNGKNDWKGVLHSWDLMKHYFAAGVSIYDYWNIALFNNEPSRWGWYQNSLITVDRESKKARFTNEYYLMKHFSHFIRPGARYVALDNPDSEAMVFRNPDGSYVVLYMEREGKERTLEIRNHDKTQKFTISPNSINTIIL